MTDPSLSQPDAFAFEGALAFTAGFADTATFVGADRVFCAHMTGNLVVFASEAARQSGPEEWLKLATFPVFVAAVVGTTSLTRASDGPVESTAIRRVLAVVALLFAASALLGAVPGSTSPGAARIGIVALLVLAMGIQNALHRLRPGLGAPTTVMTGNLTQWLTWLVTAHTADEKEKRRGLGLIILLFVTGCMLGALGVSRFGFASLGLPTMVALFARSRVRDARASS